jgi:hypothetical protein
MRATDLKRLESMTPEKRLAEIATSIRGTQYYLEDHADVGGDIVAKLPKEARDALLKKTDECVAIINGESFIENSVSSNRSPIPTARLEHPEAYGVRYLFRK